jgi:hypothetical protein
MSLGKGPEYRVRVNAQSQTSAPMSRRLVAMSMITGLLFRDCGTSDSLAHEVGRGGGPSDVADTVQALGQRVH